jgi:hypothetical protein
VSSSCCSSPKRFQQAKHAHEALVAAAGPLVNIILSILGLIIAIPVATREFGLAVAVLNASLAFFNLLPFGMLDGGRLAKALYASADDFTDEKITFKLSVGAVIGCVAAFFAGGLNLGALLLIWGVHRQEDRDNPDDHTHHRSMGNKSALAWACLWAAISVSALLVMAALDDFSSYT